MHRRSLLAALLPLLAGCAGIDDPPGQGSSLSGKGTRPTTEPGTSIRGTETDEPLPNLPEPDDDCTVVDRPEGDYPSLPDSLTEAAASQFALDHERAYAAGNLAADPQRDVDGVDETDADVTETTEEGVLLRVRVTLSYTEGEATATVAESVESRAWYYVAEGYAIRARDDDSDAIPDRGWVTVACAGE